LRWKKGGGLETLREIKGIIIICQEENGF